MDTNTNTANQNQNIDTTGDQLPAGFVMPRTYMAFSAKMVEEISARRYPVTGKYAPLWLKRDAILQATKAGIEWAQKLEVGDTFLGSEWAATAAYPHTMDRALRGFFVKSAEPVLAALMIRRADGKVEEIRPLGSPCPKCGQRLKVLCGTVDDVCTSNLKDWL